MGSVFRTLYSDTSNWTHTTYQKLEIPEGTMTGIFSSALLSFGTNMVFSRCDLHLSFKGAGVAILAKLVQMTFTVAQHHLLKTPQELPAEDQSPKEASSDETTLEPTKLKYSLICIQSYYSKSAEFVCFYLKKIPLPISVSPQTAYCSVPPADWYIAIGLLLFSFRKITSPAIDPWTTILSTWALSRMCDPTNFVTMPFCVVLKI